VLAKPGPGAMAKVVRDIKLLLPHSTDVPSTSVQNLNRHIKILEEPKILADSHSREGVLVDQNFVPVPTETLSSSVISASTSLDPEFQSSSVLSPTLTTSSEESAKAKVHVPDPPAITLWKVSMDGKTYTIKSGGTVLNARKSGFPGVQVLFKPSDVVKDYDSDIWCYVTKQPENVFLVDGVGLKDKFVLYLPISDQLSAERDDNWNEIFGKFRIFPSIEPPTNPPPANLWINLA
jgi:hypothetical protein